MSKHDPSATPLIRVSPSGVHGLGAFATRPLPAFALLGLYEGRRYTPKQIAAKEWNDQLTYLFTLSNQETIDGAKGGNATRHLNHSCEPNCEAVEEYDDAGKLILKFQTLQPVDAGEELFIDYCLTADDGSSPADYPCHCGAPSCRGTMLAPAEPDEAAPSDDALAGLVEERGQMTRIAPIEHLPAEQTQAPLPSGA